MKGKAARPAFRAYHLPPERGHCDIPRKMVDVHDHLVPALATLHGERPHAFNPHKRSGFQTQVTS
jgi:hypothetical protein